MRASTTPGPRGEPLIVILNDNGMSIDPNVGGVSPASGPPALQARSTTHFKKCYRQAARTHTQAGSGSTGAATT